MNYERGGVIGHWSVVSGYLRIISYEFRVKAFVCILNVDLTIGFLLLASGLQLAASGL